MRDDRRCCSCDAADWIWHHTSGVKLCWNPSRQIAMLPLNVTSDGVVPGERSRAVRAGDANALVTLTNVSAKVRLVAIGSLAEWTSQFSAWKYKFLFI